MSATLARGPLWARPGDTEEQTLPLWRALLIALGVEIILPFLLLGVDWSMLQFWREPPPVPVMSVRLEQPREEVPPPEPPKKKKPRREREVKQVPIVVPKPLPNEVQAKIVLPKPEVKPKPKPKPEEEKPPEPVPEPEAPPLPSVFRDIKPVKKVKPKYPREAEDAHIQGRVRVRLTVEVNGSVSAAKILSAEPPGVFDAAVMEAVVQYIFKRDGTSYQADQEIIFKLE
jgi:protein TonB